MNKLFLLFFCLVSLSFAQTRYLNGHLTTEGAINHCGADSGSVNAYVCANASGATITAYRDGAFYSFRATHTNTGSATLAIDGLSAITIKKLAGTNNLVAGDILTNSEIVVRYNSNSAFFELQSPSGTNTPTLAALNVTALTQPSAPTVTPTCTGTCATTYTYSVVALTAAGTYTTQASSVTSTSAQASTLDSSHFNTVTTASVTNAISCNVYRTVGGATQGKIGNVVCGNALVDNGLTGDSTTAPTTNTSGMMLSQNVNAMRFADQYAGGTVGAKIIAAIADLPSTGGLVIVNTPGSLGTSTINVGTGNADTGNKPVTLWFANYGIWTCAVTSPNPCFEIGIRSTIMGLNMRETYLKNTGTGPIIQVTSPAENGQIHDLRLQGGSNAIKMRAISTGADTPNWRLHDLFMENQTGNAVEAASWSDGEYLRDSFINSPGGACVRIGIIDNGDTTLGGTNENSDISNVFCQNAGTKGIWLEQNILTTAAQFVSIKIQQIQISSPANDGLWIKGGAIGLDINNIQFVGIVGSAASNTYDAVHLEQVSGGAGHVSTKISGIFQPDNIHPRYSLYWNVITSGGGNSNTIDRVAVANGATAAFYLLGQIVLWGDYPNNTYDVASAFQHFHSDSTNLLRMGDSSGFYWNFTKVGTTALTGTNAAEANPRVSLDGNICGGGMAGTGGTIGIGPISSNGYRICTTANAVVSIFAGSQAVFTGSGSTVGFPNAVSTPSSSSATCSTGQFAFDANYFYACVATNTWRRSANTTW